MKKIAIVAASALCCVTAFAATASSSSSGQGIYIQGQLGMAQTNFAKITGQPIPNAKFTWKNGNSGFTWGGDIGYSFSDTYAVEAGAFSLAKITSTVSPYNVSESYRDTLAYLAAVMRTQVGSSQFYVSGKFGLGYQRFTAPSTSEQFVKTSTYWGPMFAAQLGYAITNNLGLSLQYARFAGLAQHAAAGKKMKVTLNPNVITLGIGYWFNLS